VLTRLLLLSSPDGLGAPSLYAADGSVWFTYTLCVLQAALAILFLVGYHTRLTGIVSYILLYSLQGRKPGVAVWGRHDIAPRLILGVVSAD